MRIKWRPAWNDEGVASTVGTILALLVFLTFLSLITNQYVPVWMNDAEAAHMNTVFAQYGDLKSSIDNQILSCTVAQLVNRPCSRTASFTPITLGVDGVPIFSGPTVGFLDLLPGGSTTFVQFGYGLVGQTAYVNETANGTVRLDVPNRYFIPQTVIYENGAIVRFQQDGEIVRARPQFIVTDLGEFVEVRFDLIRAELLTTDLQDYANVTTSIWINHTTDYPTAWYHYFNNTLAEAFGITQDDYDTKANHTWSNPNPDLETADNPYYFVRRTKTSGGDFWVFVELKNTLKDISLFSLNRAWLDMELGGAAPRGG